MNQSLRSKGGNRQLNNSSWRIEHTVSIMDRKTTKNNKGKNFTKQPHKSASYNSHIKSFAPHSRTHTFKCMY